MAKSNKLDYKTKTYLLVAGFFGLVALGAVVGNGLFSQNKSSGTASVASVVNPVVTSQVLGANTETGGYKIAVTKKIVMTNELTLGVDKKRVVLTTDIANVDVQTLQFSPLLQISVLDEDGTSYPMTMQFIENGRIIGGPIEAGKHLQYDLDFVLPVNKTPKTFRFVSEAGKPAQDLAL